MDTPAKPKPMHWVVRMSTIEGTADRGVLKYRSMIARMSVAYADEAPDDESTLIISAAPHLRSSETTNLTSMASLMLNRPGFSSMPNSRLPLGTHRSFASACPSGYVARMTKYEENEGAFDLK